MSIINEEYKDNIREINHNTCYSNFDGVCVIHNLNFKSAENIMKDLEKGAWILWIYRNNFINKKLNAITIKVDDNLVHHKEFLYGYNFKDFQVHEIDVEITNYKNDNKIYVTKSYNSLEEFLDKLEKIYGLDKNKQVIYEDDNDFI